ncbi:hypothetical protein AHAS_Ahas13G0057000 [Arachis hypogaea]
MDWMEKMEHYVSLKPETLKLSCNGSDAAFNKAASFTLQGVWKLNPISFVAKGQKRDFLLPLLNSTSINEVNVSLTIYLFFLAKKQ